MELKPWKLGVLYNNEMRQRNFYIQEHCANMYRVDSTQIVVILEIDSIKNPPPHMQ